MNSLFPSTAYSSAELFLIERDAIFSANWHFAGFLRDLANHNDYVSVEIGANSIVVQNFHGEVKAFHNVCSHRFSRIQATGCGNRPLQCPYHGWKFDGEGLPCAIPKRPRFDDLSDATLAKLALKGLRVESVGELVFVTDSASLPSLCESLGDLHEVVRTMADCFGEKLDSNVMEIAANWKVTVENTLESYHVAFIHAETFCRLGLSGEDFTFAGPHSSWTSELNLEMAQRMQKVGNFLASRPYQIPGYQHIFLFPNLTIATTQGLTFSVQVFEPLAFDRTRFSSFVFATKPGKQLSAAEEMIQASLNKSAVDFNRKVFEEDRYICEMVQLGCEDSQQRAGVLSSEELRVYAFQVEASKMTQRSE